MCDGAVVQDSPSVKSPYTATVNVPSEMRVVMSANLEDTEGEEDPDTAGRRFYKFRQDVPMPSYLLAIACGDLEFRQIGPRSKVRGRLGIAHVCKLTWLEACLCLDLHRYQIGCKERWKVQGCQGRALKLLFMQVWSEPSQVEAAAYEFAETDDFLKAGQAWSSHFSQGLYTSFHQLRCTTTMTVVHHLA